MDQDDGELRIQSAHMLALKYMKQEKFEKAQELIDLLPEQNPLDKRLLQADLYLQQRAELKEAEKLLQRKLYMEVMNLNGILLRLVKILLAQEDSEKAARVADITRDAVELLGFGSYFAQIAPLDIALANQDKAESLRLLKALMEAVPSGLQRTAEHPLYDQLPEVRSAAPAIASTILPPLIANLDQSPEYDFLRGEREFQMLLKRYREAQMN